MVMLDRTFKQHLAFQAHQQHVYDVFLLTVRPACVCSVNSTFAFSQTSPDRNTSWSAMLPGHVEAPCTPVWLVISDTGRLLRCHRSNAPGVLCSGRDSGATP